MKLLCRFRETIFGRHLATWASRRVPRSTRRSQNMVQGTMVREEIASKWEIVKLYVVVECAN